MNRTATINRQTNETAIELSIRLDGNGTHQIDSGVGFFDHMLTAFARHGLFDLEITCRGDTHIDAHHTVEDIGICLGMAVREALGDKSGITRYGSISLPMDETLVTAAVDLCGRSFLVFQVDLPTERVGEFDTELVQDFMEAFTVHAGLNLHVILHHGRNCHHMIEAIFKATARALRQAVAIDARETGIPSSKGSL